MRCQQAPPAHAVDAATHRLSLRLLPASDQAHAPETTRTETIQITLNNRFARVGDCGNCGGVLNWSPSPGGHRWPRHIPSRPNPIQHRHPNPGSSSLTNVLRNVGRCRTAQRRTAQHRAPNTEPQSAPPTRSPIPNRPTRSNHGSLTTRTVHQIRFRTLHEHRTKETR